MKNIKLLILACLCLASSLSKSQPGFQRTYGGPNDDFYWSIQKGPSGRWLLVGRSESFPTSNNTNNMAYAVSVDDWGNLIWDEVYEEGNINWFCDAIYDGNEYLVTGRNEINADQDILLMKLNPSNGNIVTNSSWSYNHNTTGVTAEYGRTMELEGNRLHIAGYTTNTNVNHLFLGTFDPGTGVPVNTNFYNPPSIHEFGNDIAISSTQNGRAFCGEDGVKEVSYMIVQETVGGVNHDWQCRIADATTPSVQLDLQSIIATSDGAYAGVGRWGDDMLFIKFRRAVDGGGVDFAIRYGGQGLERGNGLIETADRGFALLGQSNSWSTNGDNDLYLVRIDQFGTLVWSMTYGGAAEETSGSYGRIHQLSNGGFLFGGTTESFGAGNQDFYLIKTDANGISGCNEQAVTTIASDPNLDWNMMNLNAVATNHPQANLAQNTPGTQTAVDILCGSCDNWHKTTDNNSSFDQGNDITTDNLGNVYVTGTYNSSTSFDNIAIPSVATNYHSGMFLTKYDECGNVVWSAYSVAPTQFSDEEVTGDGIVLDQLNQRAYVTGRYVHGTNEFYGGDGSNTFFSPTPTLGWSSGLYVTEYDMYTGAILSIHNHEVKNEDLYPAAIAMDEDLELFVVGRQVDWTNPASFLYKLPSSSSNGYHMKGEYLSEATDIDALGKSNRLYITGNFENQIQFNHASALTCSGTEDGYLGWVTDMGNSASFFHMAQANSTGSGFARLNGISIDMYDYPCVVGTFSGSLSSPVTSSLSINSASSQSNLLVARIHPSATWASGSWIQQSSGGQEETGRDIITQNDYLFVVGHHTANFNLPGHNIIHFGPGNNMYHASFNLPNGTCNWLSGSTGDGQLPNGIAADASLNLFCTGSYTGTLNLWVGGTPVLAGSPSTNTFCYTSRVDGTYGGFYEIVGAEEPIEKSLEAYPNPTDGLIRIQLENVATSVQVDILNEIGQTVKTQRFGETATLNLDLSDLGAGIYFLSTTTNEGSSYYQKIIVH